MKCEGPKTLKMPFSSSTSDSYKSISETYLLYIKLNSLGFFSLFFIVMPLNAYGTLVVVSQTFSDCKCLLAYALTKTTFKVINFRPQAWFNLGWRLQNYVEPRLATVALNRLGLCRELRRNTKWSNFVLSKKEEGGKKGDKSSFFQSTL